MAKKLKKKEDIKPVKKYTTEEAKRNVFECTEAVVGTETFLKKHADRLNAREPLSENENVNASEELTKLSFALGIETGYVIASCAGERYQMLALEMKKGLEKEFNCQSISEKALVDLAVGAYIRNIRYMWKMDNNQEYLGKQYDGYRNYLSREVDRSYRHYISAIETLKFMKQPSLKVNVKTNNAFISENQQFNNNAKSNEAK